MLQTADELSRDNSTARHDMSTNIVLHDEDEGRKAE